MQTQASAAERGIVVAHGYGIKIHVYRRHLIVEDGIGRSRRTRRFHRASAKLNRLVLIGHTGYVTLDALRWLRDVNAALVHIDADGRLLTTSVASGSGLASLRRAQALAAGGPDGIEIARELLAAKVSGQRALLDELPGGSVSIEPVERAHGEVERATSIGTLLGAEAQAASAYWQAWSSLTVPLVARDAAKLPEHWLTFGQRASLLTGGPRLASNPPNAILNYLYALLEAETILACHAVGLDPSLGIFHTDQRDRASLAFDAMEAVRPAVDAYLLALLTQRTLSVRDFAETRQGACRMTQRLAASLAETSTAWRDQIAPVVERVAHTLAGHATAPVPRFTPLTRSNWKAAWDERAPNRRERIKSGSTLELAATCRDCGVELPSRRHRYCGDCRLQRWAADASRGRQIAGQVLASLRAEQRDPGHGGRAAELRGAKNRAHQRAVRDWTGERADSGVFANEILPSLRALPIARLAEATGLSDHYCSLIRLGKRTPHPRHWEALRRVGFPGKAPPLPPPSSV
jgi:CRISPR-associated endonuclease Cas1